MTLTALRSVGDLQIIRAYPFNLCHPCSRYIEDAYLYKDPYQPGF